MADGCRAFNFPAPQSSRLRPGEIVIDLFAGGGGASEALKQAIGIDPALAYNHDEWAIGMHAANHPLTIHHREDIWHADPRRDVAGRPVGWFHASPDCTHFSQAKGGQPRSRKTRALSWVVLKWIGQLLEADRRNGTDTAPRIVSLENVWQILTWGPLVAKRDKATGRVIKMDGSVAAPGERVPVENQQLVPDKRRAGRTWRQFVAALRGYGYEVEWRKLRACDYGAGTSRERLFLIARRDGEPIRWPEPTHGPGRASAYVPAAAAIDFSDLGRSIFDRPRPLADATLRRIARGVVRHVLQAQEPFFLTEFANAGNGGRTWSAAEPLRTQCAGVKGGHFALVAPSLVKFRGDSIGTPITDPVPTITSGGGAKRPAGAAHALGVMAAFLEQACGGYYEGAGKDLRHPAPTICANGSIQRLVAAQLEKFDGSNGCDSGCDSGRAFRGSGGRDDLAPDAEGWLGQRPGGGATPRGAQDAERLPGAEDGCGPEAALGVCAQARLDGASRPHPGRDADQPHRRVQDEQPAVESGAGDAEREHTARLRHGIDGAAAEHASAEASPGEECGEGVALGGNDVPGDREGTGHFADAGVQGRALRVAAFLLSYYGNGGAPSLADPLDTITTRDRMALVTVTIQGTPYVITDIRLRMLKPAELFRAQGFPPDYVIDRTADGRPISNTHAVRMVGNSVSPPPLRAIAEANLDPVINQLARAA